MDIDEEIKRTWQRRREDHSAGGIAYRRTPDNELEVALIATRHGTRWQLPKGAREYGETAEQTARREVKEEVGLLTESDSFLRTIEYWYWDTHHKETPELVHKIVDFFLLHMSGGRLSADSFEVDDAAWFTPAQAVELLTFSSERMVMQDALERLAAGSQR